MAFGLRHCSLKRLVGAFEREFGEVAYMSRERNCMHIQFEESVDVGLVQLEACHFGLLTNIFQHSNVGIRILLLIGNTVATIGYVEEFYRLDAIYGEFLLPISSAHELLKCI